MGGNKAPKKNKNIMYIDNLCKLRVCHPTSCHRTQIFYFTEVFFKGFLKVNSMFFANSSKQWQKRKLLNRNYKDTKDKKKK